jgi:hypothetical protein
MCGKKGFVDAVWKEKETMMFFLSTKHGITRIFAGEIEEFCENSCYFCFNKLKIAYE